LMAWMHTLLNLLLHDAWSAYQSLHLLEGHPGMAWRSGARLSICLEGGWTGGLEGSCQHLGLLDGAIRWLRLLLVLNAGVHWKHWGQMFLEFRT